MERRVFLKGMTALTASALPLASRAEANGKTAYDPGARFDIEVSEIPFRRNAAGRELKARIYRPKAAGPFPVLLDLHGGAWYRKDRTANEPMDRAVAASGVLVVAIDMTVAGEAPYPAAVQDASYGVRWLKSRAKEWHGEATTLGLLGSSSGGHVAELLAMRPNDKRYTALALPSSMKADTGIAYVVTRSPISDPYARWQQAEKLKREPLIKASRTFFNPWPSIHEANPQEILDRREAVELRPLLVMQGALDDNVLPAVQEKFAAAYNGAGGECRLEVFEGCEHEWIAKPGPQTDRAHEMVKAFIARQLARA
jgi:acetyl esterase/lipase